MSVMTALYNSYVYCEENDLVDKVENIENETVLLPIYHSNKESQGEDIVEVILNKDSEIVSASFLEKGETAIFPVTEDSVSRSSGIAPHSLSDEVSYLINKDEMKNAAYINHLEKWMRFSKKNNNKSFVFLEIIKKFLNRNNFLEDIFRKCYKEKYISICYNDKEKGKIKVELTYFDNKEKEKMKDITKVFITFKIQNLFNNEKDYSVTNYKQLHKDYIEYIFDEKEKNEKEICDISGKEIYCSSKHRGLFGTSKLISVSNHNETYFGRLKKGEEIISIGYETSQKIHNMLKYFLENGKNNTYLGESSYLINWFSDDINNSENISVTRDIDSLFDIEFIEGNSKSDIYNENILKYLSGNYTKINDTAQYYIMIVNKISNGRLSIKYFRELKKSEFYERISKWYDSISWIGYNFKKKEQERKYPGIYKILDYTYGVEREGKIEFNQKKYKRDLMESLITVMIEGKKIPLSIVKKMYSNVSNRHRYDKTWRTLVETSCSVFKKYYRDYFNKEVSEEMVNNKDRDFLYGRLLAVFEKIEEATFGDDKRSTNAQKLWSAYVNNPGKVMMTLIDKLQPYKRKLESSNRGLYITLEKITQEIITNLMATDDFENNKNKKLKENFIFGYYYQRNEFFKPKNNQEQE